MFIQKWEISQRITSGTSAVRMGLRPFTFYLKPPAPFFFETNTFSSPNLKPKPYFSGHYGWLVDCLELQTIRTRVPVLK